MKEIKSTTSQFFLLVATMAFLLLQCSGDKRVAPKPRAYPKIEYPQKSYRIFDTTFCPFQVEIPQYAKVKHKENYFEEALESPCWLNIEFPEFNAVLHCSYEDIDRPAKFDELKSDAFELVDKHNVRANYIDRYPIKKDNNVHGFLFKIDGPVATATQFYLTDSTNHFFRASLYFNSRVNTDSLAPVQAYLDQDINHFIESFAWQN